MTETHVYRSRLVWQGTTASGYESYERTHRVALPPGGGELELSADEAFRGNAALPNPEQLLLAAASSCQLLTFLAVAARSRVDVVSYEDEAEALMPEAQTPMRITQITLRPRIVVAEPTDLDRVRELVERSHESCFIANTLNARLIVEPRVEHPAAA